MDFSLQREKGKEKNYGLSDEEREGQFSKKGDDKNPDYARYKELDMKASEGEQAISRTRTLSGKGLRRTDCILHSLPYDLQMLKKYIVMAEALEELEEAA